MALHFCTITHGCHARVGVHLNYFLNLVNESYTEVISKFCTVVLCSFYLGSLFVRVFRANFACITECLNDPQSGHSTASSRGLGLYYENQMTGCARLFAGQSASWYHNPLLSVRLPLSSAKLVQFPHHITLNPNLSSQLSEVFFPINWTECNIMILKIQKIYVRFFTNNKGTDYFMNIPLFEVFSTFLVRNVENVASHLQNEHIYQVR